MAGKELILVINLGSTSTKVSLYEGKEEKHTENMVHTVEELKNFATINDQKDFRKEAVLDYLAKQNVKLSDLAAIAVRGGIVGQLESGAYMVNGKLVEASHNSPIAHPSNLTPIIGYELAEEAGNGIKAYMYDAVCGCGEPNPLYRITGLKEIEKQFVTHVLNSRAVSIEQAQRDGLIIADTTYVVAHLGGGISVNLIKGGKILDFVGDDDGAFSPERAGGLPTRDLVTLCYSGKFTGKEMHKEIKGKGGLVSLLGTNEFIDMEAMIDAGDVKAKLVFDAMVLQIGKDIGAMSTVVNGKVDKIILTGGIAHSKRLTKELIKRVEFIAPVAVIPGTFEMQALAWGALRVLRNEEKAHIF